MRRATMIMKLSTGLALLLGMALLSYLEAQTQPPNKGDGKGARKGFGRKAGDSTAEETPLPNRVGFGRSAEAPAAPGTLDVSLPPVSMEVVIGEWNAPRKDEKEAGKDLDELSGPTARVEEA